MAVAKISQRRRHNIVDSAAEGAESLIHSTQRATHDALEDLAGSVEQLRVKGSPAYNRAHDRTTAFAQRGIDGLRDTGRLLRERADLFSDRTTGYIRDEPVKAVLIAAAAGALTLAFMSLLARARRHDLH